MKKIVLALALISTVSSFATGYEVVQKNNGDRYFVNTCLDRITDTKAKDLLVEVRFGNGTEKLKQFASDIDSSASLEEISKIVADVERANDLCYAGEVYGYEVLKHIVKSTLQAQ